MISPTYPKDVETKLQRYDRHLYIRWNQRVSRFELWRKDKRDEMVLRIANRDGSYRQIDNRLLHYIVNHDLWKHKSPMAAHRDMLVWEAAQDETERLRYEDTMNQIGKENCHIIKRDLETA